MGNEMRAVKEARATFNFSGCSGGNGCHHKTKIFDGKILKAVVTRDKYKGGANWSRWFEVVDSALLVRVCFTGYVGRCAKGYTSFLVIYEPSGERKEIKEVQPTRIPKIITVELEGEAGKGPVKKAFPDLGGDVLDLQIIYKDVPSETSIELSRLGNNGFECAAEFEGEEGKTVKGVCQVMAIVASGEEGMK